MKFGGVILKLKLLVEVTIILFICFLGDIIHSMLNLPIPGNVIGMLILLLCLTSRIIKLDVIENVSDFLLDHLAFFFIPAGVNLISCFSLLKHKWIQIILISIISTIIIISTTGIIVQKMIRRKHV